MKIPPFSSTLLAVLCLLTLPVRLHAGPPAPGGLVLFTEYPAKNVEASEFRSVDAGPLYTTITRPDGKQIQFYNGGLWIEIPYPGAGAYGSSKAADANLEKIHQALDKYPQFKSQLLAAQEKWQPLASSAQPQQESQAKAAPAPVPAFAADAPALGVSSASASTTAETFSFVARDGAKFNNVSISGSDPEALTLVTQSGIERVSFERIPKDIQERFHYDAAQATLYRDALWSDDLKAALVRARATNKMVLISFVSSDSNELSQQMERETFSQKAFRDYAMKNLVLVQFDYPQTKALPADVKARNLSMKSRFAVSSYPSYVVLSKLGDSLGSTSYTPGGPAAFIAWAGKYHNP